jgi:hypothetical protein
VDGFIVTGRKFRQTYKEGQMETGSKISGIPDNHHNLEEERENFSLHIFRENMPLSILYF